MTQSNLCLVRSWFRGVPTFLKCLHGSHFLLQGDLLDAFGIKVGQPKKDHEGSQAVSKVTATWIDGCSLYQVGL